jgi:hypothetical protein
VQISGDKREQKTASLILYRPALNALSILNINTWQKRQTGDVQTVLVVPQLRWPAFHPKSCHMGSVAEKVILDRHYILSRFRGVTIDGVCIGEWIH